MAFPAGLQNIWLSTIRHGSRAIGIASRQSTGCTRRSSSAREQLPGIAEEEQHRRPKAPPLPGYGKYPYGRGGWPVQGGTTQGHRNPFSPERPFRQKPPPLPVGQGAGESLKPDARHVRHGAGYRKGRPAALPGAVHQRATKGTTRSGGISRYSLRIASRNKRSSVNLTHCFGFNSFCFRNDRHPDAFFSASAVSTVLPGCALRPEEDEPGREGARVRAGEAGRRPHSPHPQSRRRDP